MKPKSRKQRFRELESMWNQELFASVVEAARDYLKDYPGHSLARLYFGIALSELARYDEAKRMFLQVIKESDSEQLGYLYSRMGHLYRQKGEFHRAAEWYRKAQSSCRTEAAYPIFLGAVLALDGRLSEAEVCHRQALKCKTGDFSEAWLNLGYVLRAREKYKPALKCFEKALALDPGYRGAKRAIKDVKKALEWKQRKSSQSA
jgi:tetratricopeptide (TPR) repeat protein